MRYGDCQDVLADFADVLSPRSIWTKGTGGVEKGKGLNKKYIGCTNMKSGQIIATSHDLTPNGGLVREIPLFQGNLGWCDQNNI